LEDLQPILAFHQCEQDEEIKYMDENSLYPHMLTNKVYSIGHRTVINDNFDSSLK